jgi:hypothetical protein
MGYLQIYENPNLINLCICSLCIVVVTKADTNDVLNVESD